jgi:hypothetical protein
VTFWRQKKVSKIDIPRAEVNAHETQQKTLTPPFYHFSIAQVTHTDQTNRIEKLGQTKYRAADSSQAAQITQK